MAERIGYVVIEWNQASLQPDVLDGTFVTNLEWAKEYAVAEQAKTDEIGRRERYTVAEVIEMEDDDG